jgi:6-pyruvoyltetrahydropterin/6-carboxytetrahydropterin synthase
VEVTKIFKFDAAHRLYSYQGLCNHIHGHTYVAEITISAEALNSQEMVVDFKEIKQKIGGWIDENWDHALLLHSADPLSNVIKKVIDMPRLYLFDSNPTAEAMATILCAVAEEYYRDRGALNVGSVKIWETPTSYAECTA